MQGDLLNADEVLAAGKVLGDGESGAVDVLRGERDTLAAVGDRRDLVDLEPDAAGAVPARDVGGCLREVDVEHPGVVDLLVGPEAQLGAGSDVDRLRGGTSLGSVAAQVDARHVGDLAWP